MVNRTTRAAKAPASKRGETPVRPPRRHGRGVPKPPGPREKGGGRFLSWGDGR
jgi:hypothetical protein